MNAMEQQPHEYVQTYLDNLPIEIRPDASEKLTAIMRDAYRNGWDSKFLASLVARHGYTNAHSPIGAAMYRLQKLASEKYTYSTSGTVQSQSNFNDHHCRKPGCPCEHQECYRGWHDGFIRYETNGDRVIEYDVTKPCQVCRPETWAKLNLPFG